MPTSVEAEYNKKTLKEASLSDINYQSEKVKPKLPLTKKIDIVLALTHDTQPQLAIESVQVSKSLDA